MPRYQYECQVCEQTFERRQSFTDNPLADCPLCGTKDAVDRVITSVGVIFKGPGFYITDSKNKNNSKSNGSTKSTTKSDNKKTPVTEKTEAKKSETKQPEQV